MTTREFVTTSSCYSRSKGNPRTQYSSMGLSINPQHDLLEKIAKCTSHVCEPRLCNPCGKRAQGKKKDEKG